MTRRNIGGQVDAQGLALLAGHVSDDEYVARAQRHRPDLEAIRAEALRLLAEGLTARDAAAALRIAEDQVINWAAEAAR